MVTYLSYIPLHVSIHIRVCVRIYIPVNKDAGEIECIRNSCSERRAIEEAWIEREWRQSEEG